MSRDVTEESGHAGVPGLEAREVGLQGGAFLGDNVRAEAGLQVSS